MPVVGRAGLQRNIVLVVCVRIVKRQFEPARGGSSADFVQNQVAQPENLRTLPDARQQPTLVQCGQDAIQRDPIRANRSDLRLVRLRRGRAAMVLS